MRSTLVYLLFILMLATNIFSQIIADHHAVQQFEQIPEYWIEKAKELTVHFGHTSHGSQIIAGLYWLEEQADATKYQVIVGPRNGSRAPDLPGQTNPASLRIWEEGLWPETGSGRLGYWRGEQAQNGTQEILNSGLFDVSGWSWCGQVETNEWDYIQEYLEAISQFELQSPEVTLFYMTGHCTEPGPPNHQQIAYNRLHNNNNGIRNYCIDNKKVLFDFADIESHDPDGNYYPSEDGTGTWCEDWCRQHPEDCIDLPPRAESGGGVNCDICAHSYGFNCVIKAKAFWWMMARIAGWPGVEESPADIDNETNENSAVKNFELYPNYPNPFNASTTIKYQIPQTSQVYLKIYDIIGQEQAILINEQKHEGNHQIVFNTNDLPSGVYYYELQINNLRKVRKMILLK